MSSSRDTAVSTNHERRHKAYLVVQADCVLSSRLAGFRTMKGNLVKTTSFTLAVLCLASMIQHGHRTQRRSPIPMAQGWPSVPTQVHLQVGDWPHLSNGRVKICSQELIQRACSVTARTAFNTPRTPFMTPRLGFKTLTTP